MKGRRQHWFHALTFLGVAVALVGTARAADHREAPLIREDPTADINDIFAFLDPADQGRLILAMTVNPLSAPSDNVTYAFSGDVRYSFRFDNDGDAIEEHRVDVRFSDPALGSQTYEVFLDGDFLVAGDVTPPTVEPEPNEPIIALGPMGTVAFAGQRDDPFFFDVVGFIRFLSGTGTFTGSDGFAGFNVSAIVLGLPVDALLAPPDGDDDDSSDDGSSDDDSSDEDSSDEDSSDDDSSDEDSSDEDSSDDDSSDEGESASVAGDPSFEWALQSPGVAASTTGSMLQIWGVTERRQVTLRRSSQGMLARSVGPWQQIDRMGNPAISTALIPLMSRDFYNIGRPEDDAADFAGEIVASLMSLGTNDENIGILASVAVPDTLKLDVSAPGGYPNGRAPADNVIDTLLFFIFNQTDVSDGVDANDKPFLKGFPYLASPHQPE